MYVSYPLIIYMIILHGAKSLVALMFLAIKCFLECLYGLPTELLSGGSGTQPHLLDGTFLFPNITFQCYGRVTRIRFTGYFNPNVLYNATLSVRIQFYKAGGSHYELAESVNIALNLRTFSQTQTSLQVDSRGRYYVSSPLAINLKSTVHTVLQVSPGYILGIGLPPIKSTPSGMVSHGISIVVQNDTSSPAIDVMQDSCWNPSMRRSESCSVIRKLVRPMVVLEFTKEGKQHAHHSLTWCVHTHLSTCTCMSTFSMHPHRYSCTYHYNQQHTCDAST